MRPSTTSPSRPRTQPADDGKTLDNLGTSTGTFTYQVCETDSSDCSNEVMVTGADG